MGGGRGVELCGTEGGLPTRQSSGAPDLGPGGAGAVRGGPQGRRFDERQWPWPPPVPCPPPPAPAVYWGPWRPSRGGPPTPWASPPTAVATRRTGTGPSCSPPLPPLAQTRGHSQGPRCLTPPPPRPLNGGSALHSSVKGGPPLVSLPRGGGGGDHNATPDATPRLESCSVLVTRASTRQHKKILISGTIGAFGSGRRVAGAAVLSPGTVMKSSADRPPTENTVPSDTVLFPPPHGYLSKLGGGSSGGGQLEGGGGVSWRVWGGGGSAGGCGGVDFSRWGGGATRDPQQPHAYLQGGCVSGAGLGKLPGAHTRTGPGRPPPPPLWSPPPPRGRGPHSFGFPRPPP